MTIVKMAEIRHGASLVKKKLDKKMDVRATSIAFFYKVKEERDPEIGMETKNPWGSVAWSLHSSFTSILVFMDGLLYFPNDSC